MASDSDAEVIEIGRSNAERAEVSDRVAFSVAGVDTAEPTAASGLVIANAPYGIRIEDPMPSIHALCKRFESTFEGWRMGVIVHRDVTLPLARKRSTVLADFRNGGVPVRLWGVDL